MKKIKNTIPEWDLSDLYKSVNDPKIKKDKALVEKQVKSFNKKYKGKIEKNISSKKVLEALKNYELILDNLFKISSYGYLIHALDSSNHKVSLLFSQLTEFNSKIDSELIWFVNELKQIENQKLKQLSNSSHLNNYKHYISKLIKLKPFSLSTSEEVIMTKRSLTSNQAFINFYDKTIGEERFSLKINGKREVMTLSRILPIIKTNEDRKIRKSSSLEFSNVFKKRKSFYTFTLNNLLLDKKIRDEIRGYKYPQQATFLSYEVNPKMVDSMISSVQKRTDIVERYYKTKRQLLKLKSLNELDRYVPIFPENNKIYTWNEAENIVLDAVEMASPKFRKIAKEFFDEGRIDAKLKPHKHSGASCYSPSKSTKPYILCNYAGEIGDVETLAHELGHGIHGHLYRENNSLLQMHATTATAEIASIFLESITSDKLAESINDKMMKLDYYSGKIEGMFASIFRQVEFYLFETDIHKHRREKGELSSEEFGDYFQKRLQHMFGSSLKLTDNHKYWWMYVLHFYHYDFYVFSYAFGELLSLSLYQKYKKEGRSFMKNYTKALKAGGSKSPAEITKMMGVDISDPKFWDSGLDLLEKYVDEFENLAADMPS